jgi:hypothetical protein
VTITDVIVAVIIIACAVFAGWWLLFHRPNK